MNDQHRDERQSADAVTGCAEALDRWEDEGGVGREDTPGQRRDEPPSVATEVAEPKGPFVGTNLRLFGLPLEVALAARWAAGAGPGVDLAYPAYLAEPVCTARVHPLRPSATPSGLRSVRPRLAGHKAIILCRK
jgi:hypothetical protein